MKTNTNIKIFLVLLLFIWCGQALFCSDAMAQCAMCKATIESNAELGEGNIGSGINKGILYIMGIPYLLIGAVGFLIYKHNKKLKAVL